MKGVPSTPEQRAEILRLAPTHTPKAIAAKTGLNLGNVYRILSEASVSAVRQAYTAAPDPEQKRVNCLAQWTPERREARALRKVMAADGQPAEPNPPKDRIDPRKAAEEALIASYLCHGRKPLLEIDAHGFKLRGRRCGFNQVMRETNEHRRKWGMGLIDVNQNWLPNE